MTSGETSDERPAKRRSLLPGHLFKPLESDELRMGPAVHLIARLYAVEERAKALSRH